MVRLSHRMRECVRTCATVCASVVAAENVLSKRINGEQEGNDIGINDGRSRHPINPFLNKIRIRSTKHIRMQSIMREGWLVFGSHSFFFHIFVVAAVDAGE